MIIGFEVPHAGQIVALTATCAKGVHMTVSVERLEQLLEDLEGPERAELRRPRTL